MKLFSYTNSQKLITFWAFLKKVIFNVKPPVATYGATLVKFGQLFVRKFCNDFWQNSTYCLPSVMQRQYFVIIFFGTKCTQHSINYGKLKYFYFLVSDNLVEFLPLLHFLVTRFRISREIHAEHSGQRQRLTHPSTGSILIIKYCTYPHHMSCKTDEDFS